MRPLNLTAAEQQDLVAFLESLTGQVASEIASRRSSRLTSSIPEVAVERHEVGAVRSPDGSEAEGFVERGGGGLFVLNGAR